MLFASLMCQSMISPSVQPVTRTPGPWLLSTHAPAAVVVRWAVGGRPVPSSSGMRYWRSAVEKWVDVAQTTQSMLRLSMSSPPSRVASLNVEQAP